MIILAAFFTAGIYVAGIYYPHPVATVVASCLMCCLGFVIARLQRLADAEIGLQSLTPHMTLEQVLQGIRALDVDATTPIYVASPELSPAHDMFVARFEGQRVLVIGRQEPQSPETTEVLDAKAAWNW